MRNGSWQRGSWVPRTKAAESWGFRCDQITKKPVKAHGGSRNKDQDRLDFGLRLKSRQEKSGRSLGGSSGWISILELKCGGKAESVNIYFISSSHLCLAPRSLILFRWDCTQPPSIHQKDVLYLRSDCSRGKNASEFKPKRHKKMWLPEIIFLCDEIDRYTRKRCSNFRLCVRTGCLDW